MESKHCVVFVTAKKDEALNVQEKLVKEQLAACVNLVEGVTSSFTWRFKIEKAVESLLIIKTKVALLDKLIKRVKELHSSETPEIIALPIIGGSESYLKWVDEVTS